MEAKHYYEQFRSRIKKGRKVTLFDLGTIVGSLSYLYLFERAPTCGALCVHSSLLFGIGVGGGGVIMSLAGLLTSANDYTSLSKSIKVYNRNQPQSKELSHTFNIVITDSGLGISYTF